jgi:hypothetical protein
MHISGHVSVCRCSLKNLTATRRRDSCGVQRNFVGRRDKPVCDMLGITCASRINVSVRKSRIITFSAGLNLTLSRSDNRHVGRCIPWARRPLKEITPSFGVGNKPEQYIGVIRDCLYRRLGHFNCYDRRFLCLLLLTRILRRRQKVKTRESERE